MNDGPQQLTFTTFGGETVEVIRRGKHYIQPRGYAAPPGTGPKGETCGSCAHYVRKQMARAYPKCLLRRATWTAAAQPSFRTCADARKWQAQDHRPRIKGYFYVFRSGQSEAGLFD
jgi:hypothetical protein